MIFPGMVSRRPPLSLGKLRHHVISDLRTVLTRQTCELSTSWEAAAVLERIKQSRLEITHSLKNVKKKEETLQNP